MDLNVWRERILAILRDPIWDGIGVFVALFIVLIPWILRKLEPWFTGTTFKIVFWRLSIPLLAILAIVAAFGQRLVLVAVLNLAVVLLYWLRQRELGQQGIAGRLLKLLPREEHHLPKVARHVEIIDERHYDFTIREVMRFHYRSGPLPKVRRPGSGAQPHNAWEANHVG